MFMIGQTISSLPIDLNYINYVRIENGIYDCLYVTHIDETVKTPNQFVIPDKWDKETYLHAKFNGDLFSGNTDFGVENTTNLIIKRREKGSYRWMPLIDKPIDSSTDFNFNEYDKYALAGVTYEYAAVPIINQHEGTYSIVECTPSFDCLVIMDKDETYSTIYDINISQQKNNTSSVIVPIQANYPIYVANAYNDYYTGNISATFFNITDDTQNPTISETVKFRKSILDFLNNKNIYQSLKIRLICVY